ncbi:hypothetical protein FE236_03765 [Mariprofundus erugo]|nr:hypothetical protein FE236_03765 [Mariprofundus erugo]
MALIWCTRRGVGRGFSNELAACVACECRRRKQCAPYAALTLDQIAAANSEAKSNGHAVYESMPLFEAAFTRQQVAQRDEPRRHGPDGE